MSIAYMILDFRKTQTILETKESTENQFNVSFVLLNITFWCPDEQYFILIQSKLLQWTIQLQLVQGISELHSKSKYCKEGQI